MYINLEESDIMSGRNITYSRLWFLMCHTEVINQTQYKSISVNTNGIQ